MNLGERKQYYYPTPFLVVDYVLVELQTEWLQGRLWSVI